MLPLSKTIDSTLELRCTSYGYQYSERLRSLMCVYFCGGSYVEDVITHLMKHLSLHPTLRTCSADTILCAMEELACDNTTYTLATGKQYNFNVADAMNNLLVNALLSTGQLKGNQEYDFDFGHQFIETEKYDAKPTYKKFLGYGPGIAVINDMIAGIENRYGNTNVRFNQKETLMRIFKRLEDSGICVCRARMDCGSCSEEIVETVEQHCRHFYIRANRCSYDSMFALTGWKKEEINGIEFELNSIIVEKRKTKPYRLVVQRLDSKKFGLHANSRIKAFVFKFVSVPAKWVRTSRQHVLNVYTAQATMPMPACFRQALAETSSLWNNPCVLPQVALWGKGGLCQKNRHCTICTDKNRR